MGGSFMDDSCIGGALDKRDCVAVAVGLLHLAVTTTAEGHSSDTRKAETRKGSGPPPPPARPP